MNLLEIKDPSFIKTLTIKELESLAEEIRTFLLENISKTGGHLSSNLGVVELTLALHYVFDSPNDKLIFDVGHQAYTHKILTGRAKDFSKLRKFNGLSGYQKRSESIHDVWEAGHSSTAIAAVAGFEYAKYLNNETHKNIAIVGDGSLNSGLSFEALNYLGHQKKLSPIIILNDNEMSISKNVGRLSRLLNKTRSSKMYNLAIKTKRRFPKFIYNLKVRTANMIRGFANNLSIFDEFGFSYYGPIDGHDLKNLIKFLKLIKQKNRPVVLHVVTKKGKGYSLAENDQIGSWHGVGPFNLENGENLNKNNQENHVKWSNIISEYLEKHAVDNPDFKVIVPAMIYGSGLVEFEKKFPDKIIDVGICESFSVCFSAALALNEKEIFLPIYSSFLQRAYDQVVHDLTRQDAKIVIGIDRSGIVGDDGETHQGVFDIAYLKHIPNIEIVQPSNESEAYSLLDYAFKVSKKTVAIRYSRYSTERIESNENLEIQKATWLETNRLGKANIISYGDNFAMLKNYIEENNLPINLYNALFIKPLDLVMLDKIISSNLPTYVLEDSAKISGLGSSILEYLSESSKSLQVKIYGLPDEFILQGSREEIYKKYGLDVETITKEIMEK
ncbi:MAG: 1-deoxy-D-xylulose-5-phosphate synthase [Candidatus Izemoplasmatales bacterium]